jgi:hypothetical protein
MKIAKITIEDYLYVVELKPNFIQRLFGMENKVEKYKRKSSESYTYGGGSVYFNQKGEELGNHNYIQKAIDNYRRSW